MQSSSSTPHADLPREVATSAADEGVHASSPPPASAMRGVYVTGTDTGVGKTLASATFLHALHAAGVRAAGMKPVASGCIETAAGWRNEDALALQAAGMAGLVYADINPYALPAPTAPQLAARAAGLDVRLEALLAAHARLAQVADAVVVEGVGGWMAPLADGFEQADLVRALQLPVVLVVGLRLGCLSHARLSARAIAADGCTLIGWIGSGVEAGFDADGDYRELVASALVAPCLGVFPHMRAPDPSTLASRLALPPALCGQLDRGGRPRPAKPGKPVVTTARP